jgi:hypothetical protein
METKRGPRMAPLLLSFALLATATAESSELSVWSNHYGGVYSDNGYASVATSDGGFAAVGSTFSYGAGGYDVYLLKLDSLGDTLWTRTFGDTATEYGRDLQVTPDGGFIIVGSTTSRGHGKEDVYVVRTDSYGTLLWSKTYGGALSDDGWSIRATGDGYIICGTTYSSGHGYGDLMLLKINQNGDSLWTRTYGGAGGESGYAVRVTYDGGLIAVGATGSFGTGYSSLYAVRTTATGDSIWATTFGGTRADLGYAVDVTPDGGLLFAGVTVPTGSNYYDMYVVKTDDNGTLQWERNYGGTGEDIAYSIGETADGNFLIGGTTESSGAGSVDMYAVKIDPYGNKLSDATAGGSQADYCRNVLITHTGRYLLTGYTYSYSRGGSDFYMVSLQGDQPTGVFERTDRGLPSGFQLGQNYPNPFNLSTHIQFTIPSRSEVRLTIYNILGQLVKEFPSETLPAGSYSLDWDGTTQAGAVAASGIYFYRLEADQQVQCRKMTLLK